MTKQETLVFKVIQISWLLLGISSMVITLYHMRSWSLTEVLLGGILSTLFVIISFLAQITERMTLFLK